MDCDHSNEIEVVVQSLPQFLQIESSGFSNDIVNMTQTNEDVL